MLHAIFDESRRKEIQFALKKGREIGFRKSKPLAEDMEADGIFGLGTRHSARDDSRESRGFGTTNNPLMG